MLEGPKVKVIKPKIVVVRRETRFQDLKARWVSPGMMKFKIGRAHELEEARREKRGDGKQRAGATAAAAGFSEYEAEERAYDEALKHIRGALDFGLPVKVLDRALLPTFDFWNTAVVVVVGQDGLVANTAKYVGEAPIVGVNPDPTRIDGVLLPFRPDDVRKAVQSVLDERFHSVRVAMAEAILNDGQRLLAFNDLFIGCRSHVSARYTIESGGRSEAQLSSGVLVSTGSGATGWLSSVFNMAKGIATLAGTPAPLAPTISAQDRRLFWVVREPFRSKQSSATLVAGNLQAGEELILESLMPTSGVIFSDGVEADFLEFNSGMIATVTVSEQAAHLVTK